MQIFADLLLSVALMTLIGWGWARFLTPNSTSLPMVAVSLGCVCLIWAGLWVQFLDLPYSFFPFVVLGLAAVSVLLAFLSPRKHGCLTRAHPHSFFAILALAAASLYLFPIWIQSGQGVFTLDGGDLSLYLGLPQLYKLLGSASRVWSVAANPPEIGWSVAKAVSNPIIQPSLLGGLGLWFSVCPPWTDVSTWYSALVALAFANAACGTLFLAMQLFPQSRLSSWSCAGLLMIVLNGILWVAFAHYLPHLLSIGVLGVLTGLLWLLIHEDQISEMKWLVVIVCFSTMALYYSTLLVFYGLFFACFFVPQFLRETVVRKSKITDWIKRAGLYGLLAFCLCYPGWVHSAHFLRHVSNVAIANQEDVAVPFTGGWDYAQIFMGHVAPTSLFPWNRLPGSPYAMPEGLRRLGFGLGILLLLSGFGRVICEVKGLRWTLVLFLLFSVLSIFALRHSQYRLMKLGLYLLPFTILWGSQGLSWGLNSFRRVPRAPSGGPLKIDAPLGTAPSPALRAPSPLAEGRCEKMRRVRGPGLQSIHKTFRIIVGRRAFLKGSTSRGLPQQSRISSHLQGSKQTGLLSPRPSVGEGQGGEGDLHAVDFHPSWRRAVAWGTPLTRRSYRRPFSRFTLILRGLSQFGMIAFLAVSVAFKIPLLKEVVRSSEHSFYFSKDHIDLLNKIRHSTWGEGNPLYLLSYDGFIKMAVMDAMFIGTRYYTAMTYTYLGPYPWEITDRIRSDAPEIQLLEKTPDIMDWPADDVLYENPSWKVLQLKEARYPKAFLVGPAWNAPLPLNTTQSFRWLRGRGVIGFWSPCVATCELRLEVAPERNRYGCRLRISSESQKIKSFLLTSDAKNYPSVQRIQVSIPVTRGFNWIELEPQKISEDLLQGEPWVMVTKIEFQSKNNTSEN